MSRSSRAVVIVPLMFAVGCQGLIEGPTGPNGTGTGIGSAEATGASGALANDEALAKADVSVIASSIECASGKVGIAAPLRALTTTQYANAVRDLFGGQITASKSYPASSGTSLTGFSTDSTMNSMGAGFAEGIGRAADETALAVMGKLPQLLSCASSANRACAEQFINTYATKAFRRPVAEEERSAMLALFDQGMAAHKNFSVAIAELAATILQHPLFVYLPEIGTVDGGQRKLDDYELATRLSFLLTDSPPDAELLRAAKASELSTDSNLKAQAKRLIASDAFKPVLARFTREWMHLKDVKAGDKDTALYPEFTASLASSMAQELDRFVLKAVRQGAGGFDALLNGRDTEVNAPMAALYGVQSSSKSESEWVPATLEAERSGLLTRAAVLAGYAGPTEASHIHRGKFVRTGLLCGKIGAPPNNATGLQPAYPANSTRRQKSEILQKTSPCGGCHVQMDRIGLAFDNFDAIGKRLAGDVDVHGDVVGDNDIAGEFEGASELNVLLADSTQVQQCVGKQWFRYAFGRIEGAADACSFADVAMELQTSNGDLGAMFASIAGSDGFKFRKVQ